jgi:hypothetical protein
VWWNFSYRLKLATWTLPATFTDVPLERVPSPFRNLAIQIRRLSVGLDDRPHETRLFAIDFASTGFCTLAFAEGALIESAFVNRSR